MKLDIDDAISDAIVRSSLKEHMKLLKRSIKELSAKKRLESFEEMDLQQDLVLLNAMKEVHNYFALPEDRVECMVTPPQKKIKGTK